MRLSWKILLSTLLAIITTFSIGGYLLISSLFYSSLEREIQSAKEENNMLYLLVSNSIVSVPQGNESAVNRIIQLVGSQMEGDKLKVRISDDNGESIYLSDDVAGKVPFPSENRRISQIVQGEEDKYIVQTASILVNDESRFILETFRDITTLFTDRKAQYELYQQLMIALIFVNCAIIGISTYFLTRPVMVLSKASRKIADGNYHERAKINSEDEIGTLATDFNRMADSLELRMQELEDAAKRQQDFTGSFAHELKTPLTSIIGYADMLRSQQMNDEETITVADRIFREGKRLESLSLKLLDLIVLQKQDFVLRRVEIGYYIRDVVKSFHPLLAETAIDINTDIDQGYLLIEPDLFRTLLTNLLDNALKAIPPDGNILILGSGVPEGYHIQIIDNGKGIPEDQLSRITEAFYMVDKSRSRARGGAGLGLAICTEIVDLHHGKMTIDSVLGEGTTIHLFFPEAEEEERSDEDE